MKLRLIDADTSKWYKAYINGFPTVFKFNTVESPGVYRNYIDVEVQQVVSAYSVNTLMYAKCTTIKGKPITILVYFDGVSYVTKDDLNIFTKENLDAFMKNQESHLTNLYLELGKIQSKIKASESLIEKLYDVQV